MSEQEIIAEIEEIGGVEVEGWVPPPPISSTDLVPVPQGNLFRTEDPVEIIRRATETSDALARVIQDKQLFKQIGNKNHVLVEGWTLLGSMLGVFPVVVWTKPVDEGGWEARVEARTLAGAVVGAAEAQCLRSEKEWGPNPTRGKMRDDYALRSMAQTRAVSKALRGPLGFVVTLAGFEATPAEEMSLEGHTAPQRVEGPKPLAPPKSWAALTQMVSAYDQDVHDWFFAFADSARRLLFPEAESTKALNKQDKDFLFQKCVGAALWLRDKHDPNEMPPPTLTTVRFAFASVLDGQELALEGEA